MTSGSSGRRPSDGPRPDRDRSAAGSDRPRRGSSGRRGRVERPAGGGTLSRSTLWDQDADANGPQPLRARWDPVPAAKEPPATRPARPQRRRSAIGWFVHHYGWRAYALPVLAALTVLAVVQLTGSPRSGSAATPDASTSAAGGSVTVTVASSLPTTVTVEKPGPTTTVDQVPASPTAGTGRGEPSTAPDPNGAFQGVASGVLPEGAAFAKTGAGTFHVVPGTSSPVGTGPQHRTYTIEVEDGIQSATQDPLFAKAVVNILSDTRSWIGGGDFTLQRVDSGHPDFSITLTSQMTVREPQNCGWQIQLEASCFNRLDGRVFINDARWIRGAVSYNGDIGSYRVYAINHEVGHALGFHHQPCPQSGGLAPVMMQQSWSTSDDDLAALDPSGPVKADGKVCKYNPFPYPRGGTGSQSGTASAAGSAARSTGAATGVTTAGTATITRTATSG